MSDEQTIEAIRARNEERKACLAHKGVGCYPDSGPYCGAHQDYGDGCEDIDFLLSEIEARDAEIERRDFAEENHSCCCCGECAP